MLADTRVPKHLNENADVNPDPDPTGLRSIADSILARRFVSTYIPPHRQEELLAWRPPRDTDSTYHDRNSSSPTKALTFLRPRGNLG
jgi:hypothetical protein